MQEKSKNSLIRSKTLFLCNPISYYSMDGVQYRDRYMEYIYIWTGVYANHLRMQSRGRQVINYILNNKPDKHNFLTLNSS